MHKEGSGLLQPKRQSYKLTKDSRYDALTIDIVQLFGFITLVVIKYSEVVINQTVDDDFVELIKGKIQRKHIQSKRIYLRISRKCQDCQCIRLLQSLIRLSKLVKKIITQ